MTHSDASGDIFDWRRAAIDGEWEELDAPPAVAFNRGMWSLELVLAMAEGEAWNL